MSKFNVVADHIPAIDVKNVDPKNKKRSLILQ